MWWQIIATIFVGVFTAGVAWDRFRRVRYDVNGLGNKVRKMDRNTLLALLALAKTEEEKAIIRDLFRE